MAEEKKIEVVVKEETFLSKFEGDSTDPKDEVERIHIVDGKIVALHKIENGEIVETIENP